MNPSPQAERTRVSLWGDRDSPRWDTMRVLSFLLCFVCSLATSSDKNEELANSNALNEAAAWSYMKDYNIEASEVFNRITLLNWAYATDLTETNRQAVVSIYDNVDMITVMFCEIMVIYEDNYEHVNSRIVE